jgi:hypothetical protein
MQYYLATEMRERVPSPLHHDYLDRAFNAGCTQRFDLILTVKKLFLWRENFEQLQTSFAIAEERVWQHEGANAQWKLMNLIAYLCLYIPLLSLFYIWLPMHN